MAELVIERVLEPWLEVRDPRLSSRVFDQAAPPGHPGPYCTHARITTDRFDHLTGYSGVTQARIQLDFWSQDANEARSIAALVAGDKTNPGLHAFRGRMGGVFIQRATRVDEGTDYEPPIDGSEMGWHRVRQDYRITWEEGF